MYQNLRAGKERIMAETKGRKRLIYSIEEFRRIYLPKESGEERIPVGSNKSEFGVDLTKKIISKIDTRKMS
jgi:hypothetical protein